MDSRISDLLALRLRLQIGLGQAREDGFGHTARAMEGIVTALEHEVRGLHPAQPPRAGRRT